MAKPIKKKILYLARSSGSGPVMRALALHKAIGRLGLDLTGRVEFKALCLSPYEWLLGPWGVPKIDLGFEARSLKHAVGKALEEFKPDIILSNYLIREPQDALLLAGLPAGCKNYLILRQFLDYEEWLGRFNFDPAAWHGVIAIEPGIKARVTPFVGSCPVVEVPPVLSTWPDELLPAGPARARLLELAEVRDYGRPLALVAHNGRSGGAEMRAVIGRARQANHTALRQTLYYSQDRNSPGVIHHQPLARYYRAVDQLVAAPGYNTFWEWNKYGPAGAEAVWLPQRRSFEDQAARVSSAGEPVDREKLAAQPNGAEIIFSRVLGLRPRRGPGTAKQNKNAAGPEQATAIARVAITGAGAGAGAGAEEEARGAHATA